MVDTNHNTERVKNQHLKYNERVIIEIRIKDGWSPYKIAKEYGFASNTVRNEIARGTVEQIKNGKKVYIYCADAGQYRYEYNREGSKPKFKRLKCANFIDYICDKIEENEWSIDAAVGDAKLHEMFAPEESVCTKTMYNYIDLGLLRIKNIDLPMKLRRSTKPKRVRENKRILGNSIDERSKSIENRKEFGHWEADLVLGSKSGGDEALLTLAERKTRNYLAIKIDGKTSEDVMAAFEKIELDFGSGFNYVFKTITADNGSEFAELFKLEELPDVKVYFTHPYAAFEKGTNERHNGLLRRFIKKGTRIDGYSIDEIAFAEDWCNTLPRKILGYYSPDELFNRELDLIYAM
jgi:transposase, IS30 family